MENLSDLDYLSNPIKSENIEYDEENDDNFWSYLTAIPSQLVSMINSLLNTTSYAGYYPDNDLSTDEDEEEKYYSERSQSLSQSQSDEQSRSLEDSYENSPPRNRNERIRKEEKKPTTNKESLRPRENNSARRDYSYGPRRSRNEEIGFRESDNSRNTRLSRRDSIKRDNNPEIKYRDKNNNTEISRRRDREQSRERENSFRSQMRDPREKLKRETGTNKSITREKSPRERKKGTRNRESRRERSREISLPPPQKNKDKKSESRSDRGRSPEASSLRPNRSAYPNISPSRRSRSRSRSRQRVPKNEKREKPQIPSSRSPSSQRSSYKEKDFKKPIPQSREPIRLKRSSRRDEEDPIRRNNPRNPKSDPEALLVRNKFPSSRLRNSREQSSSISSVNLSSAQRATDTLRRASGKPELLPDESSQPQYEDGDIDSVDSLVKLLDQYMERIKEQYKVNIENRRRLKQLMDAILKIREEIITGTLELSYSQLAGMLPYIYVPSKNKDEMPIIKWQSQDNLTDKEEENSCTICLLEYSMGEKLKVLPCFHKFHVECVDRWLETHNTCPVCKYETDKGIRKN